MMISNVRYPARCVDKLLKNDITKNPPVQSCALYSDAQYFYLTKEKQIRRDNHCLSYNSKNRHFLSRACKDDPGTWTYSQDDLLIFDGIDLCMTMLNQSYIDMTKCNSSDTRQQWNWPFKSIILR